MNKVVLILLVFFAQSAMASGLTRVETTVLTNDGQKLSAVLTIPDGQVLSSALILPGSGNVGLDGDVSGPFLGTGYHGQPAKLSEQIADSFASVGVATLRYSKRGVDDAAQLPNQKFPFLVDDAKSAFELLQSKFPKAKTIIIGFSEGGLVASILSTQVKSDALFLMAPVVRPIDEVFSYQFLAWPVELVKNNLAAFSTRSDSLLPLIGRPWSDIDFNKDNQLSVTDELLPTYQGFYTAVRGLLSTPALSYWYESLKALPAFSQYAGAIKAPVINVYQGMDDAQLRPSWIVEDMNFFPVKPTLHLFPGLGHCFSPMDGSMGEVKTSGPYSNQVLDQLMKDAQALK